jgi:hypothetical protein
MANDRKEWLEAIRRELARQHEQWQRAQGQLAQLGDVQIRVPVELLEEIEGSAAHVGTVNVNAVRG